MIVKSGENVTARWEGTCHVPIVHKLSGGPQNLPPGAYVAAAVSMSENQNSGNFVDRQNYHLKIIDVLGSKPGIRPLLEAAMDKICAQPLEGKETDRECINGINPMYSE